MAEKPILVLQMQRMGDLILSFPLFLWLQRQYPDTPVWVAAEQTFSTPLMPVSPQVRFISWSDTSALRNQSFTTILNLSIRPEAAELAGQLASETKLGPVMDRGVLRVLGPWQLYRTGIVKNNYYNRFHWADLNALDMVELERMGSTRFDEPRQLDPGATKVGLFLGASDTAKRPDAAFWAELVRELLGRGLRPVLFGGPGEVELGAEVARLAQVPVLNLCGKLGLDELSIAGQTLALFITPDTGPMHLAAWTGLRCLNLSMGNVNPWETGPYAPGHYVLRADMDCAKGCWTCDQKSLLCHDPVVASRVAGLAGRIVAGDGPDKLGKMRLPGLALFRTGRDSHGLHALDRLDAAIPDATDRLSRFWQEWFGHVHGLWPDTGPQERWREYAESYPQDAQTILDELPGLGKQFRSGLTSGTPLNESFWSESPSPIKPFTGHVQMVLKNSDHSREAWAEALRLLEALLRSCT